MRTTPFAAFRSRGSTLADLTDWLGDKLDKSLMRVSSPFLLIEVGSISSLRSKMYLSSNLTTWNTRRLPWRRNAVACDASTWWPVVSQTLSSGSQTSYVVPLRSETSTLHVYASFSQPWYKKIAIRIYITLPLSATASSCLHSETAELSRYHTKSSETNQSRGA